MLVLANLAGVGSLPPKAEDHPLWTAFFWVVMGAAVLVFVWGLLWAVLIVANFVLGFTGRSIRFVRARAGALPRIRIVIERRTEGKPDPASVADPILPPASTSPAANDEPTYEGSAKLAALARQVIETQERAAPYRDDDAELGLSYVCPHCGHRTFTARGAPAILDHIELNHGGQGQGGATSGDVGGPAPKLANVPAGPIREGFVKELQTERQAISRKGSDYGTEIWRLPTTATPSLERHWRAQVKGWEERVARFEQKWGINATFTKEVDAVAPQLRASELANVPPPAWRGDLVARLRAGGLWLNRHDAEKWG